MFLRIYVPSPILRHAPSCARPGTATTDAHQPAPQLQSPIDSTTRFNSGRDWIESRLEVLSASLTVAGRRELGLAAVAAGFEDQAGLQLVQAKLEAGGVFVGVQETLDAGMQRREFARDARPDVVE